MDNYNLEVKERFGNTEAFKEYEARSENYTEEDFSNAGKGMDAIFRKFSECKAEGNGPHSEKTQALVKELQKYITDNFYTCTDKILGGLGVMYIFDERFTKNIDKHGEGTAEFASSAIDIYCSK